MFFAGLLSQTGTAVRSESAAGPTGRHHAGHSCAGRAERFGTGGQDAVAGQLYRRWEGNRRARDGGELGGELDR